MGVNWLWLLPLLVLGFANFAIAGLVLARNQKINNISFAVFSLSIGVWVVGIAEFFSAPSASAALAWAQVYYLAPLFIALSGTFFAVTFPDLPLRMKPALFVPLLSGFFGLATLLVVNRNFLMHGLVYHEWGKEVELNHGAYLLYSLYVMAFFAVILVIMRKKSKKLRHLSALQARLFFEGLTVTAILGLLFNLILPLLGNYRLIGLGPLCTSISVTMLGYAIVRHRMFDVRLVVARSLGYVLTLTALAGIYAFVVFGLAHLIFDESFNTKTQLLLSFATAFAALFFSFLKRAFDKLSDRLFYHDAYDPQDLIDQLNRLLVSTLDLNRLTKEVPALLAENIKAQFCLIILNETPEHALRVSGTAKRTITPEDMATIRSAMSEFHQDVISADALDEKKYGALKRVLLGNDIAVLVRLIPDVQNSREELGYVALGAKKSGNSYVSKDFRVLDTVANVLILAVQNALHFEEIRNFNATLQENVNVATTKLRRSNQKLQTLDETKDEFITMASHQLRTPLTAVKGYLSMVLEGDAGELNPNQRKLLEQSFNSSQRMVYLIADLLNLSRLSTGKFVIELSPTNLAEVVQAEVDQLVETAKSREVELNYHMPESFPEIMLDETKIRQVVMNFIDNAIYYTPPGGTITIELRDTASYVEYLVHDTGIGVPKAEQYHLFSKFYRAENARRARPDGTGLGLFMAKKVVVAQGGAIIFQSVEGKGSTFGFRFNKRTHRLAAK